MPKLTSVDSAIQKSRRYIRKVLQNKETSLKFTNFQSKSCIIYKLNKYHYYDTELHVINHQTIKYLSTQAKLPNFVELIHLDLCNIKDDGLIQFMKGWWNNVRFLALGSNAITGRGIEALTEGTNLNMLKQLSLNDNYLDANAGKFLSKGSWKKLEQLNLNFNTLGDLGLKNLSTHSWRLLKELHLLKNNIGNEGVIALVTMAIPQLQKLYLSHNYITDDGCKVLAKGQWRHLKTLELDGNYLKDDSLQYIILLGSYNFERLTLFASKTCVINTAQKQATMPTMAGLALLCKGCWTQLKLQVCLNKLGQMSKSNFITVPTVKQMLKMGNTSINLALK